MKDFKKLVHKTEFKIGVGIGITTIAFIAGAYLGIDIEANVFKKWFKEGKILPTRKFLDSLPKNVAAGIDKNCAAVLDLVREDDFFISATPEWHEAMVKYCTEHSDEILKAAGKK